MKTVHRVTAEFLVTLEGPSPTDQISTHMASAEKVSREAVRGWLKSLSQPTPTGVEYSVPLGTEFVQIIP